MILKPTFQPDIKARRCRRFYGLVAREVHDLRNEGPDWLRYRHGIVVYRNDSYPEKDPSHIHLVPRDVTMERFPGVWPPPTRYSARFANGEWVAVDWIREPKSFGHEDPYIGRVLHLRRFFFEIRFGTGSGRMRAFDIWPQPDQKGLIWPWEPKRFKKKP